MTCNIKLQVDNATGEQELVDVDTAVLHVNGAEMTVGQHARSSQMEMAKRAANKFPSAWLGGGTYKLPLEEVQHLGDGECFIDGKPVATITLASSTDMQVCRAVVESRFEVEHCGTVYRVVCETPKGAVRMTAHELMTGTLPTEEQPRQQVETSNGFWLRYAGRVTRVVHKAS